MLHPLPTLTLVWISPNDLAPGMYVPRCINTDVDPECEVVLRRDPSFNARFAAVVFEHDPHTAHDFDRHYLTAIVAPEGWTAPEPPPARAPFELVGAGIVDVPPALV